MIYEEFLQINKKVINNTKEKLVKCMKRWNKKDTNDQEAYKKIPKINHNKRNAN